jgi:hypothetical protein
MIQIIFETDNSAFEPYPEVEASRILRELAREFKDFAITPEPPFNEVSIRDLNGNTIGKCAWTTGVRTP